MGVKSLEKIGYVLDLRRASGFKEIALLLKQNLLKSVIDVNQRTKEKEKSLTA